MDNNPLVYSNRAVAYQSIGKLRLAEADLIEAVKANAAHSNIYNLAAVQRGLGKHQDCIRTLSRLLQSNPAFPPAYTLRGTCYYELEDYSLAIAEFLRANAIDPSQAQSYHYLGLSMRALNRPKEANKFLLHSANLYLEQGRQEQYQEVMQLLVNESG